jgi:hypothetical protein
MGSREPSALPVGDQKDRKKARDGRSHHTHLFHGAQGIGSPAARWQRCSVFGTTALPWSASGTWTPARGTRTASD